MQNLITKSNKTFHLDFKKIHFMYKSDYFDKKAYFFFEQKTAFWVE
jgi:hypothetical protein